VNDDVPQYQRSENVMTCDPVSDCCGVVMATQLLTCCRSDEWIKAACHSACT